MRDRMAPGGSKRGRGRSALACASLASLALACDPGVSLAPTVIACDAGSTCPNDPPETQADVDQCRARAGGVCGPAYQAYYDCYAGERVCAYNGTTDVLATEQACAREVNAVAACGDGGGPG